MSEKGGQRITAIERLQLRLRSLKGRVVIVYMQIDKNGEPEAIAIQDIGRSERLRDTSDRINEED
ncbi:MAG: hypothetical protein DWQ07_12725 [Chloroflexi bacterium]|nr:MAG: hypothetical protein DWQ07_12725 [Chloroflexota bacterium]MBL1196903.1 hypothetical protein [Chloroflexota bacterium]NOH14199.1 hypothetical protein [Chloroflexota bacterium]